MGVPVRIAAKMLMLMLGHGLPAMAVPMDWRAAESPGQCDATRPIDPGVPSQFVVGLTGKGTHLTLQFIGWRLPVNADNAMKVELRFDQGKPIITDALVIAPIAAFQLFVRFMPVPEADFWRQLLSARRLTVTGPFQPGQVAIDLTDMAGALPILRDCASRQLPGQALLFEPPGP
jgi:hypothetical protein